jgi:hypothetical protein
MLKTSWMIADTLTGTLPTPRQKWLPIEEPRGPMFIVNALERCYALLLRAWTPIVVENPKQETPSEGHTACSLTDKSSSPWCRR